MRTVGFLLVVLSLGLIYGQTFVSGDVEGVWNAANSPYIVDNIVRIPVGDTLIIQSGVDVIFNFNGGILVDSSAVLRAIGNSTDSISFTAQNPDSGWMGIRFDHSLEYSALSYCNITNVKIQSNGSELNDGGAVILDNSDVNIMHTTISDCSTNQYGGGIDCIHSNPNIYYCVIENNYARFGGGGISLRDGSNAVIFNSTIENNSVAFAVGNGAGIASFNSSPTISRNIIKNNDAPTADGGGIYIENADSTTVIVNNNIDNNSAYYGGGIHSVNSTCSIENNDINNNSVTSDGGGIYSSNSNLTIVGNHIEQNVAPEGNGAGFYGQDDGDGYIIFSDNYIRTNSSFDNGGAIFADNLTMTVDGNIITDNVSQGKGGAIFLDNSQAEISKNDLSDNHSKTGGAIYTDNSAIKILLNIISRNTSYDTAPSGRGGAIVCLNANNAEIAGNLISSNSSSTNGGGLYIDNCSNLIFTNNTVADNNASADGGGIYSNASSMAIVNSIVYGNSAENGGEIYATNCSLFLGYSDILFSEIFSDNWSSCVYSDGITDAEPGFSLDARYSLTPLSSCIDAGVGSIYIASWDTTIDMLAYDIYGTERPQLAGWDIGAVEYIGYGALSSVENHKPISTEISLSTYPNPFNSEMKIGTSIPCGENMKISVYDIFGRKIGTIYNGITENDNQTFIWNADNEPSGTYVICLEHNNQISETTVKLVR
ncbi:right-handed parallel beta-helix repeat-containing protein [bacterium]|nr:right-handed parallel beta-helix repeat-containing protein [bacterium]